MSGELGIDKMALDVYERMKLMMGGQNELQISLFAEYSKYVQSCI